MTTLWSLIVVASLGGSPGAWEASLGSPEWSEREEAERRLTAALVLSPTSLKELARSYSAEVCARYASASRRAKTTRRAATASAVDGRYGVLPYCDAAWYDPKAKQYSGRCPDDWWFSLAVRDALGEYLRKASGPFAGDPYPSHRLATRAAVIDLRLAGLPWESIDSFVANMRARDLAACTDKKYPYAQALPVPLPMPARP